MNGFKTRTDGADRLLHTAPRPADSVLNTTDVTPAMIQAHVQRAQQLRSQHLADLLRHVFRKSTQAAAGMTGAMADTHDAVVRGGSRTRA